MKLSQCLWQTYKEFSNDAEIPSHRLMVRAGLIHKSGAGLYNYMPFLIKSLRKVENIIREELDRVGCQEITMSVVTPADIWKESGRWDEFTGLMLKFKDKNERELCISPTNEETVVDIFRSFVKSYKQLPVTLYQINTKFRDEIRPRFGLMRGREFTMKDAYSFHLNKESLDLVYNDLYQAYSNTFRRMGLEFVAVQADAGAMADSSCQTHEFQVLADSGEDVIVYTENGSYAANIEKAVSIRKGLDFKYTDERPKQVDTPNQQTIEEVCSFLKAPQCQSLKSLVLSIGLEDNKRELVLVQLLGDDTLNEVKFTAYVGSKDVRAANDHELEQAKLVKGYIGPIDAATKLRIVFDKAVDLKAAYVVGAQIEHKHLVNFVPQRDMANTKFEIAELRSSKEGDFSINDSSPIKLRKGIEVGHVFQLGDKYTKSMNTTILNQDGKTMHPLMGCYGIGVTRVVAAAIEQNHDDNGIIWPKMIAPFDIYFTLIAKSDELKQEAETIYRELKNEGFDVLLDDRNAGPGFKFKDADLLGLPVQIVLGEKSYEQNKNIEVILRRTGTKQLVERGQLVSHLKHIWNEIQ